MRYLRPLVAAAFASLLASAAACGSSNDGASSSSGSSTSTSTTSSSTSTSTSSSSSSSSSGAPACSAGATTANTMIGGARPVEVHVPKGYDPTKPTPVVMLLHGYSASGLIQEAYMKFQPVADQRGFLYLHPDGLVDSTGEHFWNATDACCDFGGKNPDDSAYLEGLIEEIEKTYCVDKKRIFLVGHSNGGFMSYRMACDHASTFAAIASLAGAMNEDASKCKPSEPVSILEIHGNADMVIGYDGGQNFGHKYPSATTTVTDWVGFDGCNTTPDKTAPAIDLDASLPGAETTKQIWKGCKSSTDVELWTIAGGPHIPMLSPEFAPDVIDFLFAHPKP